MRDRSLEPARYLGELRAYCRAVPSQRVLVVDDDVSIRVLVRVVLKRDHLDVDEASNGTEALARLHAQRYDAVVLDLMMGPGSGFDVLDALKSERPGDKVVVVLSATSESTINQLDEANIFAKIRKPFDVDELRAAVRDCCRH